MTHAHSLHTWNTLQTGLRKITWVRLHLCHLSCSSFTFWKHLQLLKGQFTPKQDIRIYAMQKHTNMTVATHAAVSFSFSFVFTRDLYNTHYITYFMAHSFYAYLTPPIVVGVLLTCQSLDPEYKTTAFFQMYFQEKNIVLYSGQYSFTKLKSDHFVFASNLEIIESNLD